MLERPTERLPAHQHAFDITVSGEDQPMAPHTYMRGEVIQAAE